MAYQKRKNPYVIKGKNIVTSSAETEWCKLLKKQLDTGQYSPRGQYSVNLLFNPTDEGYLNLVAKVDEMIDTAFNEAMNDDGEAKLVASKKKALQKASPFKDHITKEKDDEGNWTVEVETGKMMLQAKLKNVLDRKEGQNYVKIIDGNNIEIPADTAPEIGNGSTVKAKIFFNPYYMATTNTIGVSLSLGAVKIIDLVEYNGGGDGEDFGDDESTFNKSDDSFVADDDEIDF